MSERNAKSNTCQYTDSKEGIDNESEYSVSMSSTPFGIAWNNKNPTTNKNEKRNVFVQHVKKYSPAYHQIIVGSKLIKLQNTNVEGLKCNEIMKTFKSVYTKCITTKSPLKMTLRKPENYNKSERDSNQSMDNNFELNTARTVFMDINTFYKTWRTLPSNVLLDALLIFPNIYTEWITQTNQLILNAKYSKVLNDRVFRNLLQWKNEQGLLITVNKKNNLTFWRRLSKILISFSDPTTYKTTKYNPLQLDIKYYENISDSFKYNIYLKDIKNAIDLSFQNSEINVSVIKEILYQSNPTLNIYDNHRSNMTDSVSMSLTEAQIDEILDQIDMVYDQGNKNNDGFTD